MKYMKKIVGERIYLSPVNAQDAETYAAWLNDYAVTDGLGMSASVVSVASEKDWAEKNANCYQFAIVRSSDDALLGNCGIQDIDQLHQRCEVGVFIGDEANRSKGYGSEALGLLVRYGFDYLNINNVMLKVFSFNERAIGCYKKVGFKEMGRRRKSYYLKGQFYDAVYMDMLREDLAE